jgi:hypothetical protein
MIAPDIHRALIALGVLSGLAGGLGTALVIALIRWLA